ncbi:MAG: glycosyltransferase family 9 protein [Acidimicrobiales bacterium]
MSPDPDRPTGRPDHEASYDEVRRVLVIRALPGLGDMLCAAPALRALRTACPQADLALLGLPGASEVLARSGHHVDRVLPFQGWPGIPEGPARCPGEGADAADGWAPVDLGVAYAGLVALQRERFDLVLQLHGDGSVTNQLALAVGGRHTAGFHASSAPAPGTGTFHPYPDDLHEIHRQTRLLELLGMPLDGDHLEMSVSDDDRRRARDVVGSAWSAPYVCLHPGASCPNRRWPPERFAAVGDALARQGIAVVLTGSPGEATLTAAVAAAMAEPSIDVAGRLTLGPLAALLQQARLAVTNDTGTSHLSVAVRVPSVVVFGGPDPSDPRRWAPLDTDRHRAVVPAGPGWPESAEVVDQAHDLLSRPVAAHSDRVGRAGEDGTGRAELL